MGALWRSQIRMIRWARVAVRSWVRPGSAGESQTVPTCLATPDTPGHPTPPRSSPGWQTGSWRTGICWRQRRRRCSRPETRNRDRGSPGYGEGPPFGSRGTGPSVLLLAGGLVVPEPRRSCHSSIVRPICRISSRSCAGSRKSRPKSGSDRSTPETCRGAVMHRAELGIFLSHGCSLESSPRRGLCPVDGRGWFRGADRADGVVAVETRGVCAEVARLGSTNPEGDGAAPARGRVSGRPERARRVAVQGLGRSAAPVDAVDEVADRGGEGGGRLLRDKMPDVRDRDCGDVA